MKNRIIDEVRGAASENRFSPVVLTASLFFQK
jgi:hypothetical protein